MNIKNIILVILIISGGALFLVFQKYSKDYHSSLEQPQVPAIDKPAPR